MSVRFLRDVSYTECLERQPFARERLEGVDPAIVQATWRGVTGAGTATAHQDVVDAVNDTLPIKHAIALLTDEVIAAWALTLHAPEMEEGVTRKESPFSLRKRARSTWEEIARLLEEGMEVIHGMGQDGSMGWPIIRGLVMGDQPAEALKRMKRLAALVGRMKQNLRGVKDSTDHGPIPEQLDGVERGGDVQRLVTGELALAADPIMQRDLAQRLLEQRADLQQVLSPVPKGSGPMVILRDQSGSMTHFGRDEWCTACVIALTTIAWSENRPVKLIDFSTSTREWDLSVGNSAELGKAIASFLDGGTEIGPALRIAAKAIKDWARHGVTGADVVLLSDGIDSNYAAMDKALDEMGEIRLFSVAIACRFSGPLRTRATLYTEISGTDADEVEAVAGAV